MDGVATIKIEDLQTAPLRQHERYQYEEKRA